MPRRPGSRPGRRATRAPRSGELARAIGGWWWTCPPRSAQDNRRPRSARLAGRVRRAPEPSRRTSSTARTSRSRARRTSLDRTGAPRGGRSQSSDEGRRAVGASHKRPIQKPSPIPVRSGATERTTSRMPTIPRSAAASSVVGAETATRRRRRSRRSTGCCDSSLQSGWPGCRRTDAVGPHHLVVLVLDDVAVPDELARRGEARPHPRDLAGISDDRVLEA